MNQPLKLMAPASELQTATCLCTDALIIELNRRASTNKKELLEHLLIPSECLVEELQRRNPQYKIHWDDAADNDIRVAALSKRCTEFEDLVKLQDNAITQERKKTMELLAQVNSEESKPITTNDYCVSVTNDYELDQLCERRGYRTLKPEQLAEISATSKRQEETIQKLQAQSVANYQQKATLTESEITTENIHRWEQAWPVALANLGRVMFCLQRSKLDATKKYAAYGKIDPSLVMTSLEQYTSKIMEMESFAPCLASSPEMKDLIATQPNHPNAIKAMAPYRLLHHILGMATELEEVLQSFLNSCQRFVEASFDEGVVSQPYVTIDSFDKVNLGEEFGDDMWYKAGACNSLGLSLQQVMDTNLAKLQKRYEEKAKAMQEMLHEAYATFTPKAAQNRDIAAEIAVLKEGIKWAPIGISPLDAAVLETKKAACTDLASQLTVPSATLEGLCPDCSTPLRQVSLGQAQSVSICPKCEPEFLTEVPSGGVVPGEFAPGVIAAIPDVLPCSTDLWPVGSVGYRARPRRLQGVPMTIVEWNPEVPAHPQMRKVRFEDPAEAHQSNEPVYHFDTIHVDNLSATPVT